MRGFTQYFHQFISTLICAGSIGLVGCSASGIFSKSSNATHLSQASVTSEMASFSSSNITTAFQSTYAPGQCMDIRSGNESAGVRVEIYNCNGQSPQKFDLRADTGELRTGDDAMCVDDGGGQGNNGDPIILWPCNGGAGQKWHFNSSGQLQGINNRCIDIPYGQTAATTQLQLWDCNDGPTQKWTSSDITTAFQSAYVPGQCMDIRSGNESAGARVEIYDCDGLSNQTFHLKSDTGELRTGDDSMCVDDSGEQGNNGDAIILSPCSGGAGQKWSLNSNGQLQGINNRCIDIPYGQTVATTPLQLWDCNNGPTQKWTSPHLTIEFQSMYVPGQCMDIRSGIESTGARVEIFNCNGLNPQKFDLRSDTSELRTADESMCVADDGGEGQNGDPIILAPCTGAPEEKWHLNLSGQLQGINNRCIDIPYGQTAATTQLQLWDCNDGPTQKWTSPNLSIALQSTYAPGQCMDIRSGDESAGVRVEIYNCNGLSPQNFHLRPDTGELRTADDSMCVDDGGGQGQNGDPIILWPCTGGAGQKWHLNSLGQFQGINNRCIDIPFGQTAATTQLQLWDCNDGPTQKWVFTMPQSVTSEIPSFCFPKVTPPAINVTSFADIVTIFDTEYNSFQSQKSSNPLCAAGNTNMLVGFNNLPAMSGADQLSAATLQSLSQAKFSLARSNLWLPTSVNTDGTVNESWAVAQDAQWRAMINQGIQPVPVLAGIRLAGQTRLQTYQLLKTQMVSIATRFPYLKYIEFFNELDRTGAGSLDGTIFYNDNDPGGPTANPSITTTSTFDLGVNYGQMLNIVIPAVKAVNPQIKILLGGIGSGQGTDLIDGVYSANAAQYFDILSFHNYGAPMSPGCMMDGYTFKHDLEYTHGDFSKTLWMTEFGVGGNDQIAAWGWGAVGPANTATNIGASSDNYETDSDMGCIQLAQETGIYQAVLVYNLYPTGEGVPPAAGDSSIPWGDYYPSGRTNMDYGSNLLYADGTPRPVVACLQQFEANPSSFISGGATCAGNIAPWVKPY